MVDKVMFSSNSTEWETPQEFYDALDKLYKFNLDPCATHENAKCDNYFTKDQDGLSKDWHAIVYNPEYKSPYIQLPGRVYCNPPYGQPENPCKPNCEKKKCIKRGWHTDAYIPGISDWVKKAHEEFYNGNAEVIVMLLPARTCTKWFHTYIWNEYENQPMPNVTVRFLSGRLYFTDAIHTAPFPSMLVIWEAE